MAHRDLRDGAQAHRLSAEVLTHLQLNRALLERQHLLRRAEVPVLAMVEHLVGLQAQEVMPPYEGLWSRLEGFEPDELGRLLERRKVVRLTLMRGTVHLVSVRDALSLRPLMQPVIERGHNGAFGRRMGGADQDELAAAVRELLAEEPLGARELGRRLVARGIGQDAEAIGNATRVYEPLVQVPPRGVWGKSGRALYATLASWTGRELEANPSPDDLVLRYLGAFGPASVIDMQSWCGLTKLRDAMQRLGNRLMSFRDEDGRELYDLHEAPRPDPDTPAPVRFLGQYDNVLLGHKDRRRVIPPDFAWAEMLAPGRFVSNLLVDGVLGATWWLDRDGDRAMLVIRPDRRFTKRERQEVADEAERMAAFRQADDVRFERPVR